jgi:cell volume regulation protein A
MTDTLTIFAIIGAIIAIGFSSNALFRRTGFPDSLFLMLIGIILGPLLGVFLREEMLLVSPLLTTLTLMMILFEGGLNMEIYKVLSRVSGQRFWRFSTL